MSGGGATETPAANGFLIALLGTASTSDDAQAAEPWMRLSAATGSRTFGRSPREPIAKRW
jgi:hypothetical protein